MTQTLRMDATQRRDFFATITDERSDLMTDIDRLLAIGVRYDCALDIVHFFRTRNDLAGLEEYIENIKSRKVEVSDR